MARRRWQTCLRPLLLTAGLGLLLGALSCVEAVQPIMGPPLPVTSTIVNNGPGNQADPHVSGALVSYTDQQSNSVTVHVHDLLAGTDITIPNPNPNNNAVDFFSDISGSTVVYTHFTATGAAIMAYDAATGGPPVELAPLAGSDRRLPAIGGPTVAWSDFGFYTNPALAELVLYDLPTGTTTRLTNDLMYDTTPAVSPSGDVIAWVKCGTLGTSCDIWQATRSGSGWTTTALTAGSTAEELGPDTNGTLVVYDSLRDGEEDIYWQPVGGGPEQQLLLPGADRNPNIAGTLICFEHFDATVSVHSWNIYLYDVSTNVLYRLTQIPEDETLNDITIDDVTGLVRVVLTKNEAGNLNVYALSFPQSALSQMGVPFGTFALTRLQIRLHDQNDKVQIAGTFTPGAGPQVDPTTQPVSLTLTRPGEATPFWPPSGVIPIQGFTLSGNTYSISPAEKQRTGINAFDLVTGWGFNAVDTDAPLAAGTYAQVDVVLQIGTQVGALTAQLVENPIGSGNWQLK